ncbi:MAG: hypothetical protein MR051_08840 [Lentisphaeria bacterium]|nr:hypothetical protein [Lentisphaeria bacterium]
MVPKRPPTGKFRFRLIGGSLQLRIEDEDALHNVLTLDEAFWAMTGCDVESLRFDRRFLEFLDADGDRHIQCAEVKAAVEFLLARLDDLSGVVSGSNVLLLDAIAADGPDGPALRESFRLIARNLGKDEGAGLTAEEIRADRGTVGFSRRNGDGIITADADVSADLAAMVDRIIASGRAVTDRSGGRGVSRAEIESFETAAAARLAHAAEAENDPAIMVYGDRTAEAWRLFQECEALIDGYFLNTAAAGFLTGDPARTGKLECAADLMVPGDVRRALESAVAARPDHGGELDFSAPLNPLYAAKLRQLAESDVLKKFLIGSRLDPTSWAAAKAALAPYGAWRAKFPADDGLDNFTREELARFLAGDELAELKKLSDADLEFALAVDSSTMLLKLALFQRDMMEFLNNFVALPDLFDTRRPSRLQMGKLVMDGRHFTLAVPVKNAAEHKRIILSSNICVIYVEISRNVAGVPEKKLLAVAVTGGTMRTLFVGKHGVFFDTDGNIYDARISEMVDQPVSIGEALKAPFFRFADFLGRQAEKIFNTRNAEIQKNMSAELSKTGTPAKPAAAAPAPSNLPMMLMGGGIGIAALGSSVAFIAKSLQNVSFLTVLAVLAGIIVIFGGPMVVVSLVKLYFRSLSRFLESCGCAVNRRMRLSRRMGAIFTFTPRRPKGELLLIDPAELLPLSRRTSPRFWKILAMLLAILLGGASGVVLTRWWVARTRTPERTATATQEAPPPAGAEHKVAIPVPAASRAAEKNIKEK